MRRALALGVFFTSISSSLFADSQFGESIGLRLETQWRIGQKHETQSRWQHSFAIAKTGELFRFIRPVYGVDASYSHAEPETQLASLVYERRSPFVFEYQLGSIGDTKTMLFGVPVAHQISPVNSANGKESSWVANPWVWVGAAAVGVAAAAGGGGGGGSSSGFHGGGTEVNVGPSNNSGEDCVSGEGTNIGSDNPVDVEVGCGTGL